MSISHPFDRRSLLAHDPHSRWLWLGTWQEGADDRNSLQLLRVTTAGDTAAAVRIPLDRVTVLRGRVQSYARRVYSGLPESFRARVSSGELAQAFLGQIARPSETAVDAMVASEDGTLWLRRTSAAARSPTQWTGYHVDRGFVGFVELPVEYHLLAASEGMLWTVDQDPLGLPTITGWAHESRATAGR